MPNWPKLLRAIFDQPEPNGLKDFDTYADLEAWFELHKELRLPSPNLCDDFADESLHIAAVDGYHIDRCLVNKGKAYEAIIFAKVDGTADETVYHIANAARVRDTQEYWYVDLNWGKLIHLCNFVPGGKY